MEKTTDPALTPDPQSAPDFHIPDNKFALTPGHLNKLLSPKSLAAFRALGGLRGLEYGLRTDLRAGLSVDEGVLVPVPPGGDVVGFDEATTGVFKVASSSPPSPPSPPVQTQTQTQTQAPFTDRIHTFSANHIPEPKRKTLLHLLWAAYNDKIIILLTIAAVISLALGVYEAVSGQSQVDWIEGVAICVAIAIVVAATAGNDWQKERQFARLNRRKIDRTVTATRSGKPATIHVLDILVGDILHLEPGDSPPADGILISSHGLKTDESAATGESDQMKKTAGEEVWKAIVAGKDPDLDLDNLDPFIISGSKVLEGMGTYLVTSVGRYSTSGRILASLRSETEPTPLQVKLGRLAGYIGWFGSGAALILFVVLLIRFLANLPKNHDSPTVKGQHFMDILIVAVTVIVVAIPEGLPLAVTLALAFATTRMVKENNLVRLLRACETMGNATVICSDKTGTLTQNKMTVVAGVLGWDDQFSQHVDVNADNEAPTTTTNATPSEALGKLPPAQRDLLTKSIGLNSTAFEEEKDGGKTFVGSKTEVAMLQFAKENLGMDIVEERANAHIVHVFPFDSARKCMGVVYHYELGGGGGGGGYRLLVKGAAEIMLDASVEAVTRGKEVGVGREDFSNDARTAVARAIEMYARKSLRTIGMVYKDFASWPPVPPDDDGTVAFEDVFQDMTWIGIVGIHDPLRPEVSDAIKTCRNAGVQVKMVTGDNINTATSIATASGIKTPTGLTMEGPQFRTLSPTEMTEIIPRLQVLARSSPDDKRILVQHLKTLGETVAVTGDGTNDGPALKAADVGFSMGVSGTEIAKEASDIILLDDNFRSIVTAVKWGRSVNDAVAKFLQFQITVNITAVALTMVTAIYSSENESVLNAVQLLWVNLIMDTFAALALATDAPTEKILNRPPVPKSAPLFTPTMWKMILGQTIYKLSICLLLYFAGATILHYDDIATNPEKQLELDTIIFNTFVWMQIFNELNNRRLDNGFNIFERVHRNYWFLGINAVMVGGQILIIFVGGAAMGVKPLDGVQWAVCLGFAVLCIPWAAVLKFVPDEWVAGMLWGVTWAGRWAVRGLKGLGCLKCWRGLKRTREKV